MLVPQALRPMGTPYLECNRIDWQHTELQRRLKLAAKVGIPRKVRG